MFHEFRVYKIKTVKNLNVEKKIINNGKLNKYIETDTWKVGYNGRKKLTISHQIPSCNKSSWARQTKSFERYSLQQLTLEKDIYEEDLGYNVSWLDTRFVILIVLVYINRDQNTWSSGTVYWDFYHA